MDIEGYLQDIKIFEQLWNFAKMNFVRKTSNYNNTLITYIFEYNENPELLVIFDEKDDFYKFYFNYQLSGIDPQWILLWRYDWDKSEYNNSFYKIRDYISQIIDKFADEFEEDHMIELENYFELGDLTKAAI